MRYSRNRGKVQNCPVHQPGSTVAVETAAHKGDFSAGAVQNGGSVGRTLFRANSPTGGVPERDVPIREGECLDRGHLDRGGHGGSGGRGWGGGGRHLAGARR